MKLHHALIACVLVALSPAHAQDSDSLTWARANTCERIRGYIERFPNGRHLAEARRQVTARDCPDPNAPAPPPPQVQAERPAPVNPCAEPERRWTVSLRTSDDRGALERFIRDTDTRCALVRDAAQQRLAALPRPQATTPPPRTAPQTTTAPPPQPSIPLPEMVRIPGGTFTMGSPASEPGRESDEGPQRTVQVAAFYMSRTEVTFAQWDACVADGGCSHRPEDQWGRGNQPVMGVSWNDAQEYVRWLSERTGQRYRLPTEAEWEYAARAGTTTAYSTGSSISASQARFGASSTAAGGSYSANAFGLYDMHGNVWEWTQSCYSASYGATEDCSLRVLRGGGWTDTAQYLRSAIRVGSTPTNRGSSIGFRVARTN